MRMLDPARKILRCFFPRCMLLLSMGLASCHPSSSHAQTPPAPAVSPAVSPSGKQIEAFLAQDAKHPPRKGSILFIGSSSIQLWTTLAKDFPRHSVISRGFSGSTIAHSTFYADRVVIPYQPRLVVMYAGSNDLAMGHSPERLLADYRGFVQKVHAALPGTPIAFIGITPAPAHSGRMKTLKEANSLIAEFCQATPYCTFIDTFFAFLDENGTPRQDLFVKDGLHMSKAGYVVWREVLTPFLDAQAPADKTGTL